MKTPINENELLNQAIRAFHNETGLELYTRDASKVMPYTEDFILELGSTGVEYSVELKRWVQQSNVGTIAAQLRRMPSPALLVADYVNPNMADRLRDVGVQFIDTAGNAYLNQNTFFVFVKGNRTPSPHTSPRKTSRAFNASGLKLIFSFLVEPNLVGETYRKMAETSDVALGAIGWVLNDLKDKGYVREHGKKGSRSLESTMELLDRWVETYPEKLLPELDMGLFQAKSDMPWKEIKPEAFGGCWGGEVGASLLDNYLSPAQGMLYLPREKLKNLVMEHRLRKSPENTANSSETLQIYEKFWRYDPDNLHQNSCVAPDILVYADLLASGDPRNLEAAERLYGKIRDRFQED
ncbi:type IV toxin-antitoxin system AbiEi family antitoxin [Marinobacter sp.]|uniref:type IV toxin-antitoxin system AbiEi family antitoxin n=1 Tax=Marinobacter sp. TaxID=50741 RepID=UPI00356B45D8